MRAIFLADAHLRDPQDENYQLLLKFIDQQQQLDALFLLGDIFEFWIGYRSLVFSAYIPLLEKLRQLSETGTKLYFVEGNHDFNLGPYFTETLQCTVITDQQMIDWDGQKLLVCHGDLLNPSRRYQRLRRFWRGRTVRLLAKIIHPDLVWSFAIWLSNLSKKKRQNHDPCNWDPTPLIEPFAQGQFALGADALLCGHFHKAIKQDYAGKQLLVIGDWIQQFSYIELVDGHFELKNYSA